MKIEVEIGLEMVIPELQKLPEFEENYDDYYEMYDLMVEVCYLFNGYQDDFIAKFSGADDTFYIMIDGSSGHGDHYNALSRVEYSNLFSLLWAKLLPIVDFSDLLEKCSISVDNNIDHDYIHEPEYELRREV